MAKKTKLNLTSRHPPFKLKSLGERKDHPRLLFTFPKYCQSIFAADLFRKASPLLQLFYYQDEWKYELAHHHQQLQIVFLGMSQLIIS